MQQSPMLGWASSETMLYDKGVAKAVLDMRVVGQVLETTTIIERGWMPPTSYDTVVCFNYDLNG